MGGTNFTRVPAIHPPSPPLSPLRRSITTTEEENQSNAGVEGQGGRQARPPTRRLFSHPGLHCRRAAGSEIRPLARPYPHLRTSHCVGSFLYFFFYLGRLGSRGKLEWLAFRRKAGPWRLPDLVRKAPPGGREVESPGKRQFLSGSHGRCEEFWFAVISEKHSLPLLVFW